MPAFKKSYNAEGLRWCARGQHWLEEQEFHKAHQWCKVCRSDYHKEHYDPQRAREKNFRYYYKQDLTLYDAYMYAQGGVCAICKKPPEKHRTGRNRTEVSHLSLDHDHKTGKTRGLLCQSCNFVLGWMRDNPDCVDQVHAYLVDEEPLL